MIGPIGRSLVVFLVKCYVISLELRTSGYDVTFHKKRTKGALPIYHGQQYSIVFVANKFRDDICTKHDVRDKNCARQDFRDAICTKHDFRDNIIA